MRGLLYDIDSAAHLGFVVYDKLGRWSHLGFRSGLANFFYKELDSTYFRFHRPHRVSVESFFSLFLQLLKKSEKLFLFGRRALKNSPRELDLAYGHGLLTSVLGNSILTLRIKHHSSERGSHLSGSHSSQ